MKIGSGKQNTAVASYLWERVKSELGKEVLSVLNSPTSVNHMHSRALLQGSEADSRPRAWGFQAHHLFHGCGDTWSGAVTSASLELGEAEVIMEHDTA